MPVFAAKGTRDFLPAQMRNRLSVIQTIRDTYNTFGFGPLETPAFERIETLMGKYGEEGNRLIFKIMERGEQKTGPDLALRYDLTVPLARVVAMNPSLPMPFKRYQIAPVWRADRPQKGRFCEFYQCDADIVGTPSVSADAECIAAATAVLDKLGFSDYTVHINHRELLRALVLYAGVPDQETDVLIAIDKVDKIGLIGVVSELLARNIPAEAVAKLETVLSQPSDLGQVLGQIGACPDLQALLRLLPMLGVTKFVFDLTIARGLSYYTGSIYEIRLKDGGVGSIAAGGRYDGLVGMFSNKQVPAVGISLGLERILVVMEERGLFSASQGVSSPVLVTVFSETTLCESLRIATLLRQRGMCTEVWLGKPGELGKQFKYANQIGASYAVVCGPSEIESGTVSVKNLQSGQQVSVLTSEMYSAMGFHGTS